LQKNESKKQVDSSETCHKVKVCDLAIVSVVNTRLHLPNEILLKGMQAGMHLELYYKLFGLGQAHHQMWLGLATFAKTT